MKTDIVTIQNNSLVTEKMKYGVPQGPILGMLLFLYYLGGFLEE